MKRYVALFLASLALSASLCLAGGTADYTQEVANFQQALDGFKNSGLPEVFKDVLSKGSDALVALINSPDCEGVTDAQIEAAADQLCRLIGALASQCGDVGSGKDAAFELVDPAGRIAHKAHDTELSLKAAESKPDPEIADLIATAAPTSEFSVCSVTIKASYDPHLFEGGLVPTSFNKFQKFDFVAVGTPPGGSYEWSAKISGKTASGKEASQELKLVGGQFAAVFSGVHLETMQQFGVPENGNYGIEITVFYTPPGAAQKDRCSSTFLASIEDPNQ